MPVIAMTIVAKENHPNGDALRIYQAQAGQLDCTFIANVSNNYELGDTAAVATVGTTIKNGSHLVLIKPVTLRGLPSYGMGLGVVTVPVGTDLTANYQ